jgi:hypothetical protein
MTAALVAGCHHNNDTGAASVAPRDTTRADTSSTRAASDTGYRTNDTTTMKARISDSTKADSMPMQRDTSSMKRDSTGANGTASAADSTSNQTKSGVTDTKTGKSTLGKGVTKTSPDQGQPVTAKGDTLSPGDSTSSTNR